MSLRKEILEKNTAFLVKTIKEFQEKIAVLERNVAELRSRSTNNTSNYGASSAPPKLGEIHTPNPIPRGVDTKSESHPRQGNWKSEDVSIEKFFYMGKK